MTRNIDEICARIKKGEGAIVFKLEADFVYENYLEILKALKVSNMTDDQIGGLIDYVRDVYNTYIYENLVEGNNI